jgi:succinoglycan biosynthesis protein ExoA
VTSEPALPLVSVIIPMLDELGYIEPCIEGFLGQTYPPDLLEILVVDGGSTDGSRDAVEAIAADHPSVRLIDNPKRLAAAAANLGIANAKGDVLTFLSAHGVPDRDYVATSVRLLLETGAVGVGGQYLHEGTDPRSQAIGLAMASPFGMASPHRSSTERVEVDTISHPTFRKQPMVDAGGYDETLLRNEDYEFNYRLRAAGGRLVFCPEISSVYRPRSSLRALGRQFFAYGRWKATVMRRHPRSVQPRHLVPPAAVAGAALLTVGALAGRGRRLALGGAIGYAALEILAVRATRPAEHGGSTPTFVAALPVMHATWGAGVLVGLVHEARSAWSTEPDEVGPPPDPR